MTGDHATTAPESNLVSADQRSAAMGSKLFTDAAGSKFRSAAAGSKCMSCAAGSKLMTRTAATGSRFISGSAATDVAEDGMRSRDAGTATIVGEGRKRRGKRALSRG